jgi:hypothetical protein
MKDGQGPPLSDSWLRLPGDLDRAANYGHRDNSVMDASVIDAFDVKPVD